MALPEWLRFARLLTAPRRAGSAGIVAAQRVGRDYPCGLFCYRVDQDLQCGKVLMAEHFVAVDLLDPTAVLDALVAELEGLAQSLGCGAVRSVVHGGEVGVTGGLAAAGLSPEGQLLQKSLIEEAKPRTRRLKRPSASASPPA
ncbi:MAG: hypothetical protein P4L71_21795 [Acetobacteraceae bacterium]|nr:hypothetical protein [Acetobacteraceae bacterium]